MDTTIRILEVLRLASNYSVIVPMVIYLAKIKNAQVQTHIIGCVLILSALADVTGLILYSHRMSTVMLFNVYCILQFLIIASFYYQVDIIRKFSDFFFAGVLLVLILAGLNTFSVQGLNQYQTYSWAMFSVTLVSFSIFHLLNITSGYPFDRQVSSAMGFSIGIIVYFSFNFWLFLITAFITDPADRDSSLVIWAFNNLNNIAKNLIFAWAMFQTGKVFDPNK
jgi:hypothetical protein